MYPRHREHCRRWDGKILKVKITREFAMRFFTHNVRNYTCVVLSTWPPQWVNKDKANGCTKEDRENHKISTLYKDLQATMESCVGENQSSPERHINWLSNFKWSALNTHTHTNNTKQTEQVVLELLLACNSLIFRITLLVVSFIFSRWTLETFYQG